MSDKYILRSGAIDAIKQNAGTLYTREAEFLLQKVIFLLKNAPAADVAKVVHGRWIKDDFLSDDVNNAEKCSQCGELIGWFGKLPKYCPNCGAKMDGGCEDA